MENIAIFRINYKSDFILTLNSDAGWLTPFCIKFWTGAPAQAYYAGYDGTTYTHCAPVAGHPTKLEVQFDDHHLPIGDLKFQIGYHFTVADFPTSVEDEVINQAAVIIDQDGTPMQVMLDLNGETAPEIQFSLPAYANEAQRIANEQQRIAAEIQRIANEQTRINQEQTRQQNEQQRINQEQARVNEYASLKADAVAATVAANDSATLANQKAQYAQQQGDYAKNQGDYAKEQGDTALADHQRAEADHGIAVDDHTQAGNDHTRAESDHGIAVDDHTQAGNDHTRAESDHGIAVDDHTQAGNDHTRAESDHGIAVDDHTQAGNDHTRAESDHGIAVDDHTQAGNDHTRAESDHGIAVDDHTQAGNDHTRAESDHTQAGNDHTQAGNDHTRAESDHTRAESDHAAVEVYVDSLGVFDLSKHNAVGGVLATYADLSAALTALNALDSKYKYGGMSFKFVQSSDNKYVQYRLISDTFNTTVANWQGVDDEPTAGSNNLVKSGGVINCLNNNELLPIEAMPVYNGWLDSSNKIINYKNSKYIVVEVQGGETFSKSELGNCYVMILKSFTYNPSLPYIPDFATGESGRRMSAINKLILPADAKYILMSVSHDNNLLIPEVFELDGVNLVNSLRENISNWVNTDINWSDAQKKQARKNLDFGNGDIDEFATYDSKNLVSSGGIVYSLANEKLLSLEKKKRYTGWIDSSDKIINYNSSQYIVIEVEGGEVITKSGLTNNFIAVLKSFTYNPTLPYTLDYATGETRRNGVDKLTLPDDARYILMAIKAGDNILIPDVFEIDGVNISESFAQNFGKTKIELKEYEEKTDFNVDGISTLKTYIGWLDNSNRIIDYQSSRYSVINVKGGDVVSKSYVNNGNLVILKSFILNPTLPYSFDYATGETGPHNVLDNYVLPNDAKYILFSTEKNSVSVLPQTFTINNEDILKSSKKVIGDFKYPLAEIANKVRLKGHLDGSGKIVAYGSARCIVIPVTPGDTLYIESYASDDTHGRSSVALVTTFDFNSVETLPYSLSFCTDYSSIIDVPTEDYGGLVVTVPQDARYLICRAIGNTGKTLLPKRIVINGKYDLSLSLETNITKEVILPNVFTQRTDLKIDRIFNGILGYQGMCTIDGILCSGTGSAMYIKDSTDVLFGTKSKALGITTHTNDIDYCEYSNTLITATIQPNDAEHMQICLLQNAKEKLQSDTALTEQDWLRITLSEFDNSYIMVGNCFGESCDIVYAVLIDKTNNYYNKNKRILKIKLGYQSGVYDGTFEILKNVAFPHILEIQGSKYLNGYLFISTDGKINTGNNLHSSVTVVNLETMKTTEHISYENQDEKNKGVEAEGLSFLNNKMYQIVIVRTDNTTVCQLREFDIFNLQN